MRIRSILLACETLLASFGLGVLLCGGAFPSAAQTASGALVASVPGTSGVDTSILPQPQQTHGETASRNASVHSSPVPQRRFLSHASRQMPITFIPAPGDKGSSGLFTASGANFALSLERTGLAIESVHTLPGDAGKAQAEAAAAEACFSAWRGSFCSYRIRWRQSQCQSCG